MPAIGILALTFLVVAAVQLGWMYVRNLQLVASHAADKAPPGFYVFSIDEYLHLALPIAVLVMELYMIKKMAQESRERADTISEFRELAAHSRRAEYLLDLANAIRETKMCARFTSATMEVSCHSQGQKTILEAAKGRIQQGKYEHRGLVALTPKALPGAIELAMHTPHIKVRFHDMVAISRLRFFVRDREESILGVAEGHPDLSAAQETTQSTRIRSRMLAESLERQFDDLWKSAKEMSVYVDEIIQAAMPCTKTEVRNWFSAIDCDRAKLDAALAANCSKFGRLPEDVGQPSPDSAPT